MLDKPLFDPGFAFFVYPLADSLNALYQEFLVIKNPKTRKFKFQMYHKQIIEMVKNNVAFYIGCLMWAKILKEDIKKIYKAEKMVKASMQTKNVIDWLLIELAH